MSQDYITTDTKGWIYRTFCAMSDNELAIHLKAIDTALDLFMTDEGGLINSFVREYLDDLLMIAKDALVTRFVNDSSHDDSGAKLKAMQEELD